MDRKAVLAITLTLLLLSMLTLAFNIQPVKASGTIYIRADGSVDPDTAPISTVDNVTYTFTDNINDYIVVERDNIVVDGASYVIQGTGAVNSRGIILKKRKNVTITNMEIRAFSNGILVSDSQTIIITGNNIENNTYGIWVTLYSRNNIIFRNNITESSNTGITLWNCFSNTITGNNIRNNCYGIYLVQASDNSINGNDITLSTMHGMVLSSSNSNSINRNNITAIHWHGIELYGSSNYNIISGNRIRNNFRGIWLYDSSSSNTISGNNITANSRDGIRLTWSFNNSIFGNNIKIHFHGIELSWCSNNTISTNNIMNNNRGIFLQKSLNNKIYYNNFIDNTQQVYIITLSNSNSWDNDYPSGGNYWSDHVTVDDYSGINQDEFGSDGIVDEPYIIDEYNRDNYPLVEPWSPVISAAIDFDPDILNLRSGGKWISAYIQLPEEYNAEDIDATTILLNETISPVLDPKYEFVTNSSEYLVDHDEDGILERLVKFDKAEVMALLGVGEATLTITGEVNGTSFEGSDCIRVILPSTGSGGCKGFKK